MDAIDLCIIVVSYETADLLVACLDSVEVAKRAHPELRLQVVVVDNGSRDSSVTEAGAHVLGPQILAFARNRGFAAAVNRGLALCQGRHVLLLNSDVQIRADLLVRAVRLLDTQKEIGILGPALTHPDGRPQRSVHPLPSLRTELVPSWLRSDQAGVSIPSQVEQEKSSFHIEAVEAVRGAVLFLRGDVLEELGGLDEGYFFFLEETDYCARVGAAGYRVAYASELQATHLLGASSKRHAPLATRIEYHRSLYRFMARHEGRRARNLVLVARALRNGATVLLLAGPSLLFRRLRPRVSERFGLFLWHLRGCPSDPTLARVLEQKPLDPARGD